MTYYILRNISISVYNNTSPSQKAAEILGISESDIIDFKIIKRSLDLRHKDKDIYYVYTFIFALKCNKPENKNLEIYYPKIIEDEKSYHDIKLNSRPVIIGCGPAGLFCALTFLECGIYPVILERGGRIPQRQDDIDRFIKYRIVNKENNVCFGEGGAGTFSDGKLTSRSKDARQNKVLHTFVKYGAKQSILYDNKPHLGTDVLKKIITNMTDDLISKGAQINFNSKVEDIVIDKNSVRSVAGKNFEITTNSVIVACGHSARDVYYMLYKKGVAMSQKPFAVGLRAEHRRQDIDRTTYKKHYLKAPLPAAEYILKYQDPSGRGVYTFCNCPGGTVIPCITQDETLCINGMSYSERNGINSNSAIVVTVGKEDFESDSPLAGIEFQKSLEHKAYILGGSNYAAPVMRIGDLLGHYDDRGYEKVAASYLPEVCYADLSKCIPENILSCIKNAISNFGKILYGFDSCNGILTAVESRTSSPVRILRDINLQSINVNGLFAAGEGSGYAGGIVSSAIDGIKAAQGCLNILIDKK